MPLANKRVIDIPSQSICENLLVYDLFGREDGACKDAVPQLSSTISCKSLWAARMGLITGCVCLHCDAYLAVVSSLSGVLLSYCLWVFFSLYKSTLAQGEQP